jgi:hypothetical protein
LGGKGERISGWKNKRSGEIEEAADSRLAGVPGAWNLIVPKG